MVIPGPSRPRTIGPSDPMPFGKFKGIPIDQVERSYLVWALQKSDLCRPDHDRFWPEFKQTLEDLVGPHAPVTPPVLAIMPFLGRLLVKQITLRVEGNTVVASDPDLDDDLVRALQNHQTLLRAVLSRAEPNGQGGNGTSGSARLLLGAEIRNLIRSWFGSMSRRFHPDQGGSAAGQIAINQSYRALMDDLERWETKK